MNLFKFQLIGADFLIEGKRVLLADEMGVGKSAQSIRAFDTTQASPILIMCPTVGVINWRNEIDLFSVFGWPIHLMVTRKCEPSDTGITICPYSLVSDKLKEIRWNTAILDESHYLKTRTAQRTKIMYGKVVNKTLKSGVLDNVENVYMLSGTPVPNNPSDLWPMLRYFDIYTKSYQSFERKFCTGYKKGMKLIITGGKNIPKIRKLIQPIMLRRRLKDIAPDVPDISISHMEVQPNAIDSSFNLNEIREISRVIQDAIFKSTSDNNVLYRLNKLDAPVATFRRYVGLCKLKATVEYVEKAIYNQEKIVVYAYHKDFIKLLTKMLGKYKPFVIKGGMSAKQKNAQQVGFEASQSGVMIAQIKAAGIVIRFKTANYVLFSELSYSPTDNQQALYRCMWNGRTLPLFAKVMSLCDSVDQHINGVLARKLKTINAILN